MIIVYNMFGSFVLFLSIVIDLSVWLGAFENKTLGSDNPVSLYSRISTFFRHSLIELPGFYFDVEKNRYFRLLPGHNNCNPLTKEQLQEKEREKHRARLLSEDDQPFKVQLPS